MDGTAVTAFAEIVLLVVQFQESRRSGRAFFLNLNFVYTEVTMKNTETCFISIFGIVIMSP